jgi:type III secretion system needle length determinant
MLQSVSWNLPQASTASNGEEPVLDAGILTADHSSEKSANNFTAEWALITQLETTVTPEQVAQATVANETVVPNSVDINMQDAEALIQYWLGQQPAEPVSADSAAPVMQEQPATDMPADELAALLNSTQETVKPVTEDTARLPPSNPADSALTAPQQTLANTMPKPATDMPADNAEKQQAVELAEKQRATVTVSSGNVLNSNSVIANSNPETPENPLRVADTAQTREAAVNPVAANTIVDAVETDLESAALRAPLTPNTATLASAATNITSRAPDAGFKFEGPEAKWGEQMLHALRNQVELQLQQRTQTATIRLDPPELGSMEIFLSHESGRLTVQISAAQTDVAKMLQQSSERLRQELTQQNFVQVNVQVGTASDNQREQHARHAANFQFGSESISDNQLVDEATDALLTARNQDVLITV